MPGYPWGTGLTTAFSYNDTLCSATSPTNGCNGRLTAINVSAPGETTRTTALSYDYKRGAGRVPAVEVLRMTHAAASLLREAKTAQLANVIQAGRREGMIALERSLADRVVAGDVRREDAVAAANDAETLATLLQFAR